jgi:hypothetical protein
MTEKHVLTREQMKASYPDQWLLVTDCELDSSTSLHKGRVVAHSKDRGEVHRALNSSFSFSVSSRTPASFRYCSISRTFRAAALISD